MVRARFVFVVALIAVIAGVAAPAALAQSNGRVQAIPNAVKYKDTGVKPATGRSGSASLETRVLIARDLSMLVEASTGSVESGTGPGQITKTQVKIGDWTRNFNGLASGGYWSSTLPAATALTPVQVQANIKGIDPKRNDVVTVTAPALLRPDVAVTSLSHMPQQAPNLPVTIVATVVEKNGHVGARANCMLSIDGTAVDTADNIWIDAAGTVSCEFQRVFAAAGTYGVAVTASDVNPGDWDDDNNSAQSTITIVEPTKGIRQGQLYVWQRTVEQTNFFTRTGGTPCWDGAYYACDGRQDWFFHDRLSGAYLSGSDPFLTAALDRIDVQLFTNGNISHQGTVVPDPAMGWVAQSGDYYSACSRFSQDFHDGTRWVYSGDRFQVCTSGYRSQPTIGWTGYFYHRISGDAVYYGREFFCGRLGCNTYTWNYPQHKYGNGMDLGWTNGTNVRLKVVFWDVNGKGHSADKTAQIQGTPREDTNYFNEWTDWSGTQFVQRYRSYRFEGAGFANWYNNQ